MEGMPPRLIAAGLLTEDERARIQEVMLSPTTVLTTFSGVCGLGATDQLIGVWCQHRRAGHHGF
jgi:hypothetical protein